MTSVTLTGDGTVLATGPSTAVTASGTLTAALATQAKNLVLSGPASGSAAAPTFRSLLASDFPGISNFMVSGMYHGASPGSTMTSIQATLNSLYVTPLFIPRSLTIVRIVAEVVTAGGTGSVVRLGLWNDNGTGYPGTLLLDAGTIDGTSNTVQEITISQAVTPGLYWIGAVSQGTPSPAPYLRLLTGPSALLVGSTTLPTAGQIFVGYIQTSVTGALGAFTATPAVTNAGMRMFIKIG